MLWPLSKSIHVLRTKQTEDEYEKLALAAAELFQHLVDQYYDGEITLDELEEKFRDGLRETYAVIMLTALGDRREVTEQDLAWIEERLAREFAYLDEFVVDMESGNYSRPRALWRAGLYGFPRQAWTQFSVPDGAVELMGVIPSDVCMGSVLCGCIFDVEIDIDGGMAVWWVLDPAKESCEVCIAGAVASPYYFSPDEVRRVTGA